MVKFYRDTLVSRQEVDISHYLKSFLFTKALNFRQLLKKVSKQVLILNI